MKNTKKLFAIIAAAALAGLAFASCGDGAGGGSQPSGGVTEESLNGTWTAPVAGPDGQPGAATMAILNMAYVSRWNGRDMTQGTITLRGSALAVQATHIHGAQMGAGSVWLTREMARIFLAGTGASQAETESFLDEAFRTLSGTASANAITIGDLSYTRQQ
jgi:hypothetical protein